MSTSLSNSGMAVISLDFSAQATCPSGQTELAGPGADGVQGAQAVLAIVAPPRRLAVEWQDRSLDAGRHGRRRAQRPQPVRETGLKRAGLERHQDAAKDILPRDPMGASSAP